MIVTQDKPLVMEGIAANSEDYPNIGRIYTWDGNYWLPGMIVAALKGKRVRVTVEVLS